MPNIELLEKSMPVAPIRIAALAGCRELAEEAGLTAWPRTLDTPGVPTLSGSSGRGE